MVCDLLAHSCIHHVRDFVTKSKQVRAQSYYKYPMEIVQKSEESHLNDLVPEVLTVKAALVSLMLCCVSQSPSK